MLVVMVVIVLVIDGFEVPQFIHHENGVANQFVWFTTSPAAATTAASRIGTLSRNM